MTVEEAVTWALTRSGAREALAAMARRPHAAGGSVDGGGGGGAAMRYAAGAAAMTRFDPDGMTILQAVRALPPSARDLVWRHGVEGTRPDPRLGARWRFEPVEWELVPITSEPGQFLRVAIPRRCSSDMLDRGQIVTTGRAGGARWVIPVTQLDRPARVRAARRLWTLWRAGLIRVRRITAGELQALQFEKTLPPAHPWA